MNKAVFFAWCSRADQVWLLVDACVLMLCVVIVVDRLDTLAKYH